MATRFLLATATISGTNTATRITAGETTPSARLPANSVFIQADLANTGTVYIGDSTTQSSSTLGIALSAGQGIGMDSGTAPNGLNLADIYFASSTASQKVNVLFVVL